MANYYGWQPSRPDQRDIMYTAPAQLMQELPSAVDLSTPVVPAPFEPAWNQSSLGSCGPHALGADIVYGLLRQRGVATATMPSRLFIYWISRYVMGTVNSDSGVNNRDMLKALAKFGWCDESLWPYDIRRFREQPPQACFDQAATRRDIDQYLSVPQSLAQMKACIAGGDTFVVGFSVYQSFESDTVAKTGIVPMPSSRESMVGGHDVLAVGYDEARQAFKFKNSWSPQWGDRGYGWMPMAYLGDAKLAGDFWSVKYAAVPQPLPPNPPNPPTPPLPPDPSPVTLPSTLVALDASGRELGRYKQ